MMIRKCDFCGTVYDDYGVDRRAYISLWSQENKEDNYESFDACPQCTYSLQVMMQLLKRGDDFILNVLPKKEE